MSETKISGNGEVLLKGPTLWVDGARFVVLGGELHNSSSSTPQAIVAAFDRVRSLGANTVLAPVAWDLLEPAENQFDLSLVDAMLTAARERELRLILLWFGSWKNGMSSYAPAWVKRDLDRFPRAQTRESGRIEHLSPFAVESRDADASAFSVLLGHLREVDQQRTVLMVQVENEVGLLGDSRDRSALAEKAFDGAVPETVIEAIATAPQLPVHQRWLAEGSRREGTWRTVLGESPEADEAFMAYAYASYIEKVAAAGRESYDLPLYVNAWLDVPITLDLPGTEGSSAPETQNDASGEPDVAVAAGESPGKYPSGGPLPRVAPIWRAAAPSIDFLAPDIYFGDFDKICADYNDATGRLLIPEMRRSAVGVSQMFAAVGTYGALGVAPFGIDSLTEDHPDWATLADGYRLLAAAADRIASAKPAGLIAGVRIDEKNPSVQMSMGSYALTAQTRTYGVAAPKYPAYGIVVQEDEDQLVIMGRGFTATFAHAEGAKVGILSVDELDFDGKKWTVTRRLNGDETGSGSAVYLLSLGATSPAFFPIPFVTSHTGAVRVRLYTYQ